MKTLKAIFNRLRGLDESMSKSLANPVEDRKIAIEKAKSAEDRFKKAIATSMATLKTMESDLLRMKAESSRYEGLATNALKLNKEDDAKKLLEKQAEIDNEIASLSKDIAQENSIIDRNKILLEKESKKIKTAESKTDRLSSRHEAAKNRKELAELQNSNAFDILDTFEDEVEQTENYAAALDELNTDATQSIEDKYSELTTSDTVNSKLEELKSKLNSN